MHTAESVVAMDGVFCDGIGKFARNEDTPDLQALGCIPAQMVSILLDHGSNYAEHDDWGSTVLHWAAGTGNLEGIKVLVEKLEQDEKDMDGDVRDVLWSTCASCFTTKDQATPLHWASAGVDHARFGSGGHAEVCRFLLDKAGDKKEALVRSVTSKGNTALHWACWAGSLDVAKLLVQEGDANLISCCNEDGFTAAHWAASAGQVDICNWLFACGVDFAGKESQNQEGVAPLDCALSYGRSDVMDWFRDRNISP